MTPGRRASTWLLAGPLCLGVAVAFSCSAGEQRSGTLPPASSAERAIAKAERAARKKAYEEQGERPKKGKHEPEELPPPPPPPDPEPPPVASVEVVPEVVDAGVEDAAVDAAPPPDAGALDPNAMCSALCDRAMECAKEMLDQAPPGMDRSLIEEMMKRMREECMQECLEKGKDPSTAQQKKAEECRTARDCDAFLECMRQLRDM